MKEKYEFFWERQGINIHNLPIKVRRNSTTKTIPHGHLMCERCHKDKGLIKRMRRKYECPECGNSETTVKTKFLKEDDGNLLTYNQKEYNKFMKFEEGDEIRVLGEIHLDVLPYVLPVFDKDYELSSNEDKSIAIVQKVFQYLTNKGKMLLVEVGNGKQGIIYPSYDRLMIFTLGRIPKRPEQLSLPFVNLKHFEDIQKVYKTSKDRKIEAFNKFIDFKHSGKELEIEEEKQKPVIEKFASDLSGLDMDEQQATQKEKELVN